MVGNLRLHLSLLKHWFACPLPYERVYVETRVAETAVTEIFVVFACRPATTPGIYDANFQHIPLTQKLTRDRAFINPYATNSARVLIYRKSC